MKSISIVGLGAGGHGRVIADILSRLDNYSLAGWIDNNPDLKGGNVAGANVLGDDAMINKLASTGITQVFIGLGSILDTQPRQNLSQMAQQAGLDLPSIIDPTATVSSGAHIGDGSCIFPHVVVNTGSRLGLCSIINTRATLEHDCDVGDYCHLAPGSIIGGNCKIGNFTHIGIGAVVKEGITIGNNVVIGAGAVVISNIPSHTTVFGVPAKPATPRPSE